MKRDTIDLSLILPVHNEEDIIEPVFKQIKNTLDELSIRYEVILVENGSIDASLAVIKRFAKKSRNTHALVSSKGYGSAIIKGLSAAKGTYVCYMPSDGQVDLKVLPKLWETIRNGKWDVVKIKRESRESLIRLFVSNMYSLINIILFGIPYWDINGDPRIFLRKKLALLHLVYKDSFIDTEFAVKAHRLNWKIYEIPAKTLPRAGGISTRNIMTFTEFFKNLCVFKFGEKLKKWKNSLRK